MNINFRKLNSEYAFYRASIFYIIHIEILLSILVAHSN